MYCFDILSRDGCRTNGLCPVKPLRLCQPTKPRGSVLQDHFFLTRKVASPEDAVVSGAACCERAAAAQCGVPPKSLELDQDLVLRERRAHIPRESGDPRCERERAPAHVGQYDFEAREAARLSAHDELCRGFERLVGYLCVWGVSC